MGIITVPAKSAQEVSEAMVAAGIKVIWNFAPCRIVVPEDVLVKNEDLATELAALSHHITQRKVTVNSTNSINSTSGGAGTEDGAGRGREKHLC
ncbi:MAG: Redox-sensing transcriptional repressor Rex [Dehalococcoidia bacterium]|nr:Redox-sensing transcriptional repressor Rex [Chloroflexota bacterium]